MIKTNPNAIASRTLLLRQNGSEEVVYVEIGRIENLDTYFGCHLRIAGSDSELSHCIYGIDAVQAIQLALKMVGSELNRVADAQCYFIQNSDEPGHGFEALVSKPQVGI